MISIEVKRKPLIIETDIGKKEWGLIGLDLAKQIRKRTETEKVDAKGRPFRKYSPEYLKERKLAGLSGTPNLSASTKMLAALGKGVKASKGSVRIIMSGEQGYKTWINDDIRGRRFFRVSLKQAKWITNRIKRLILTKNNK